MKWMRLINILVSLNGSTNTIVNFLHSLLLSAAIESKFAFSHFYSKNTKSICMLWVHWHFKEILRRRLSRLVDMFTSHRYLIKMRNELLKLLSSHDIVIPFILLALFQRRLVIKNSHHHLYYLTHISFLSQLNMMMLLDTMSS